MTINAIFNQASGAEHVSIDYEHFHRIFNIDIGKHSGKELETQLQNDLKAQSKEQERDKDHMELSAQEASDAMQEQHDELLMKIDTFEFTKADLQATLKDILKDKDAFAEKYGLTEHEANQTEHHALIMLSMTTTEREDYLNQLRQTDPRLADAIAEEAESRYTQRTHKISIQGSEQTHSDVDGFLTENDELDQPAGNTFSLDR